MWLRLLWLLCYPAWGACPTILNNSGMNSPPVTGGVLFGWSKRSTTLTACNSFAGGAVKLNGGPMTNSPAVYQTVATVPSLSYTWSCDFYDYDYAQLDAVDGTNPLNPSLSGFPKRATRYGWKTWSGSFLAKSNKSTVTVFGVRVCIRNCALIPATCGTNAPTPAPIYAPVITLTRTLNTNVTVSVTAPSNTGIYITRCVAHTGAGYTNVTSFWSLSSGPTTFVLESTSLPFTFNFYGLQSATSYIIDCGCSNGARSTLTSLNAVTLLRCVDKVTCPSASQCVDTSDGTAAMCSPYFDGVHLTNAPTPCRHAGGTSFATDLTTTMGGDSLTVCLVVGNNTNPTSYATAISLSYGISPTLMPCSSPSFSSVTTSGSTSYILATCLTSPGVGRALNFSLTFLPSNALVSTVVSSADSVSYPLPSILAATSRFAINPGPWSSSLTSSSTAAVLVAFSVTNIAPLSPLLRIFYGPDANPLQLECSLDRVRTNYTTVVCLTDPTTTYSASPYRWTVLAGDVSVRGTDTFNLAATFPRVTSVSASKCINSGTKVTHCPTAGSTTANPVILTVYGFNFGITTNLTLRVSVDGILCPLIGSIAGNGTTPDEASCSLPAGTGFNRNVFVQVDVQNSSPLALVSYSGPNITAMCGCDTSCLYPNLVLANCARAGGGTIHVYGSSFGQQGASVLVGSNTCDNVVHDPFSPDTHISCQLAAGYSSHSSVIVIQQNGPNSAGGTAAEISYAPCNPGTYQSGSLTTCRDCGVGTFAPLAGQLQCLPCGPGSFNNETKKTSCVACDLGTYQPLSAQISCDACKEGSFAGTSGLSACVDCAPGTYVNRTGAVDCEDCAVGTFVDFSQATECFECDMGSYATVVGQSVCSSCAPGSFSNISGATICPACVRGQYMSITGQSSCRPCDLGRYADSVASLQCSYCPPGAFANVTGSTGCQLCAKGYFQPASGGSGCGQCSIGSVSDATGENCAECPPGRQASADVCVACQPGTYQSMAASSTCLDCPEGKAVDRAGATACSTCEDGMVAAVSGMAKCAKCPDSSTQKGSPPSCACKPGFYMAYNQSCVECNPGIQCEEYGLEEGALLAKSGYVKIGNLTLFVACLDSTYCPGGLTRCAAFRTGALCNNCEPGYRPVEGASGCSLCPQEQLSFFYVSVIAFLMLLGLLLLYLFMLRTDLYLFASLSAKRRQWWQESDKEDPIDPGLRLSSGEVEVLPDMSPVVDLKAEKRIKKTLSYQFKIFITFLQLVTALLSLSDVNWPPTFQYFISGFDFINLNFLPWNYVGCIRRLRLFDKIMLTAFFPPLFLVVIGGPLLLLLRCLEKRDESDKDDSRLKRAQAKSIFWRVIVFTLFLCYPAVSRQIIAYFRCVGVPDGAGSTTYYLLSSFWEQCYDPQWYSLLAPVIIALLLYPIGIPLGLCWALVHFRPWFRYPHVLYSLGLAYSGFHPEFWWFELVDMLHKVTLTCLVALFVDRDGQILSALVVAAVYVLVLLLCMPYLRFYDNVLHLLSQVEVFLLVLSMQCGAEVSNVYSGSGTDVLVSGMLIIMVIMVITVFVVLIVRYLRLVYLRHVRRQRQGKDINGPQLGTATMTFDSIDVDKAEKAEEILVRAPSRGPRQLPTDK